MNYLCDTNILSELMRPKPNSGVLRWIEQSPSIKVSVITVDEVSYGLSWKPNSRVQEWFVRFFQKHCKVIPITEAIAWKAGWLRGQLRREGKTRTSADMLIAATVHVMGLTLVTRNVKDFKGCNIPILNPFS